MRIDRRPVPERELSLIERAEALWGFGDGLKPVAGPVAEPVSEVEPTTASLGAGLVKRKAAAIPPEPSTSLLAEKKASASLKSARMLPRVWYSIYPGLLCARPAT